MNEVLESYVPLREETADWDDVLRRARRFPRRRVVFAVAIAVAALAGGPALGVMLTRDRGPQLPAEADTSNVAVLVQPVTRKVLLKAAPWSGHEGFCYATSLALGSEKKAACIARKPQGAALISPLAGYTFDSRVVSARTVLLSGKRMPILVRHMPKLGVTFFYARGRLPILLARVELLDAGGQTLRTVRFKR